MTQWVKNHPVGHGNRENRRECVNGDIAQARGQKYDF